MKCIAHKCQNTNKQGDGVYLATTDKRCGAWEGEWSVEVWICNPCFDFITKGMDKNSQIFKNVEQILKEQK